MSRQSFGKKIVPPAPPKAADGHSTRPGPQPMQGVIGKPVGEIGVEVKPGADAVRRRAYEIYLERAAQGRPGSEETDWLQAERELGRK